MIDADSSRFKGYFVLNLGTAVAICELTQRVMGTISTVAGRGRWHTTPPGASDVLAPRDEAYIGQKYFRSDGTQAGVSGKSGAVILLMGASTDTGQKLYGDRTARHAPRDRQAALALAALQNDRAQSPGERLT
jgi:hypothetical protein